MRPEDAIPRTVADVDDWAALGPLDSSFADVDAVEARVVSISALEAGFTRIDGLEADRCGH